MLRCDIKICFTDVMVRLDALSPLAAETVKPAGGAAIGEVILATALGGGLTLALLALGWAHRTRRITVLGNVANALGRSTGRPGWVALPAVTAVSSLLTALLGMYWDIALHIGEGRDEGPLANPAHYLILLGLFGVFGAGVLAMVLPLDERPGPAAVRLTKDWHVPVGGLLLAGAGAYALLGFPLDDIWHRLFGQDVTLWGPTHLMLIGGAGLSLVGVLTLEQEGHAARSSSRGAGVQRTGRTIGGRSVGAWLRAASAMGGLLIGLSVFQAEFDFGVPQFRGVFQPFLIVTAAAVALVAARLWMGLGGAVAAVVFFLCVRGGVSLLVGPVFGEITPSLPLYLGEALIVELVALVLVRRPLALGAVAGALMGTLGMASEALWSQVAMPIAWSSDITVEALLMSLVGGLAGGVTGALLAMGLRGQLPPRRVTAPIFAAALVGVAAATANGLVATVPDDVRASFAFEEVGTGDERTADITVTLSPRDAIDDPAWVNITAWQGGGLVVQELERQSEGVYRTTEPVPLHAPYKTLLRLHDGRMLSAVPVYLPADEAIDAEDIPAENGVVRDVVPEVEILQRERKDDSSGLMWALASVVVLFCTLVLILALAWGVSRLSRRIREGESGPEWAAPSATRATADLSTTSSPERPSA